MPDLLRRTGDPREVTAPFELFGGPQAVNVAPMVPQQAATACATLMRQMSPTITGFISSGHSRMA